MTQEEKAKAYDEALEKARKELKQDLHESGVWAIQRIFSELRESEDERIRKELWEYFHELELSSDRDFSPSFTIDDILAWLEKQKEQKPVLSPEKKEYVRQLKAFVSDFVRDKKPKDVEFYQRIWNWLDGLNGELIPID